MDKRRMAELRAASSAIVVGASTVRTDNPPFKVHVPNSNPWPPIVIIGQDEVDADSRVLSSDMDRNVYWIGPKRPSNPRLIYKHANDLKECVKTAIDLAAESRWKLLLIEGGPTIFAAAFATGRVTRVFQTIFGQVFLDSVAIGISGNTDVSLKFRLASCEDTGDEVFLEWIAM